MSRHRSARRVLGALAGTGVVALLLTGCFANPIEDLVRGGAEQVVEGATGGDVALNGELPEGFPADEVPLIDGDVLFGAATGEDTAQGWLVTIKSESGDPIADAVAKLEAAGFALPAGTAEVPVEGMAIRTNGTWDVIVAGDAQGIAYTVTATQQ